ncbi:MAG: sensor histidine kinase [Mesorhizobium amorphae]|nr:MAG: sensor histidine kinase [Mesorhizobium amorphae]
MSSRLALFLFILGTLGAGLLIGSVSAPDAWYQALAKPAFNPPPWLFPPTWTVLYVLIGVAGWRVWRLPARDGLLGLWGAQMALNLIWTPVFFGLHQIGWALVVIVGLLALILVFIARAWRRDRVAAFLFVPYAAWVGFATLLTASIWRLN